MQRVWLQDHVQKENKEMYPLFKIVCDNAACLCLGWLVWYLPIVLLHVILLKQLDMIDIIKTSLTS